MLEQLPHKIQQEIRMLNRAIDGSDVFSDAKKKDLFIDLIKYSVSDKVLTILMEEDKKKFERFLISK